MPVLALLAVLAAAPDASQAEALAGQQAWVELNLAFATAAPAAHPEADRKVIGAALLRGCEGLRERDGVLASSLGELSYRFRPSASAALCQAQGALASGQTGFALESLREAHQRFPKEPTLALFFGRALLDDREPVEAMQVLGRIPGSAREHAEARRLVAAARKERDAEAEDRRDAQLRELDVGRKEAKAPVEVGPRGGGGDVLAERASGSSTLGGMRSRSHRDFAIRYFDNQRDFGQRADYEGRITAALDDASAFTRRILGFSRERPVDVILYTREEFHAHMGARAAASIAGLYSMDAIRINDAASLTQQTRATLAHEYVHAVVDEVSGGAMRSIPIWLNEGLAEYVEWRYLGSDAPPYGTRVSLRGAARANQLPRLTELAQGSLISTRDPALSYAVSALAVRRLLKSGGSVALKKLLEDMAAGEDFNGVLQRRFGISVEVLDAEVARAAAGG